MASSPRRLCASTPFWNADYSAQRMIVGCLISGRSGCYFYALACAYQVAGQSQIRLLPEFSQRSNGVLWPVRQEDAMTIIKAFNVTMTVTAHPVGDMAKVTAFRALGAAVKKCG